MIEMFNIVVRDIACYYEMYHLFNNKYYVMLPVIMNLFTNKHYFVVR